MQEALHETKTHGKLSFPYIIYRGNIPEYLHAYPLHWHDEMEIIYNEKGSGIVNVHSQRYIEIAEEVGFNQPSYFTRAFYQKYGVSPIQYRKKTI